MKNPKNLILICGDEEYLKEQKKNELLQLLTVPGSLNYNAFTGENADPAEIGRLVSTMPLFEEHRTILLTDTGWCKGSVAQEVMDAFEEIPPSTFLILCEKETEAGNRLFGLCKKRGEIFKFISVDAKRGKEASAAKTDIRNWARDYLRVNGRSIDGSVLNELAEYTGYDMQNLSTELEKLISYTWDRPAGSKITLSDIDSICSKTLTDRVFDMMNHRLSGRISKALELLEELYALKTPPMRILYIIVRQYNQAYAVKELQQEGLSDAQIQAKMDIKDWQLRRVKEQIRTTPIRDLRAGLELCAEMETKVKSGDMPDKLAVEIILTS